jgi:hypothetical protein
MFPEISAVARVLVPASAATSIRRWPNPRVSMGVTNHHGRRAQSARRFLWILFMFIIASKGATAPFREESIENLPPLEGLVTEFFRSANHSAFVSFTRHWIYPAATINETKITQNDGTTIEFFPLDNDYYAFMRKDPYFLIAHSVSNAILSPNDLLKADSLSGFDGEYYWSLSLNKPLGSIDETKGDNGEIKQERAFSFNRLELIPAKEGQRNPGAVASQLDYVRELTSVAQLGYPELINPEILTSGQWLTVQPRLGGKILAKMIGTTNRPHRIEYSMSDPQLGLASNLDYSKNTITLHQTKENHRISEVEYKILSVNLPDLNANSNLFSWRRYKDAAGDLVSMMTENNNTYQIKILTNGNIKQGITPIYQGNNPSQGRKWGILGGLMVLSFSSAFLIQRISRLNNNTNKN